MSSTIAINDDVEPQIQAETYQGPLLDDRGLFKRLFNAKTQDFLAGAAIVGSLSYATRIGVLSAATAVGVSALPAVLAAGATTGLVTGSIRFYREYKKASYDLDDPEVRRIFRNQLLMSTALSTLGGGMGYAFVNHYDFIADVAQKTGVPAWIGGNLTALANSPVGIAVADIAAPVKTMAVEAYDRALPGIAAMFESSKAFAGRVYDSLPDGVSAGIENAVQSVKGWWKSAMSAVGLSHSVSAAQAATPAVADDNNITFAERMGEGNNVSVVQQTVEPAASGRPAIDKFDPEERYLPNRHVVQTIKITPEGASVPDATPPQAVVAEAQKPEPFNVPVSEPVTPEELAALEEARAHIGPTPLYIQDYLARPTGDFAIAQPTPSFAGLDFVKTPEGMALPEFDANSTPKYLPKLTEKFTIHSWDNRFEDLTAGVTPENVDEVFAELANRHVVQTIKITPEGASVPDATPPQAVVAEAQKPEPFNVPVSEPVTPEELAALEEARAHIGPTPLYIQDYLARPTGDFAIAQPTPSFAGLDFVKTPEGMALPEFDANSTPKYLPKLTEKFTIHSWDNRFEDLTAGVTPENVDEVFAELESGLGRDNLPTGYFDKKIFTDRAAEIIAKGASGDLPMQRDISAAVVASPSPEPAIAPTHAPAPGSVKEQIGSYFEGKHLSRRAERIMEKAMSGDLQGQKDLAMNLLHGKGGFPQDSAMAMKLYDNVIAEGSVEGKYPRGAVFQAIRDKAWVQFYGYGDVPADQEAAKSAMRKLAEFNGGARRMLREWTGEKVRHVAEASKHAVASVHENVAKKMPGRLSCNFMKVDNTVVSGTCKGGNLGLKVGDKITLNP